MKMGIFVRKMGIFVRKMGKFERYETGNKQ